MMERTDGEGVRTEEKRFWKELETAKKLLWSGPLSQAKWLIDFSRRDVRGLPPEKQYQYAVGLLVFAKFTTMPSRREVVWISEKDLPTPELLDWVNLHLRRVLGDLRVRRESRMMARQWEGVLRFEGKRLIGELSIEGLNLRDAFTIRVHETFADLGKKRASLRPCAHCKKLFVAKRKDSSFCSSSCRTLHWRQGHPDKFRTLRAQAYARKLKTEHGAAVAKRYLKAKSEAAKRTAEHATTKSRT